MRASVFWTALAMLLPSLNAGQSPPPPAPQPTPPFTDESSKMDAQPSLGGPRRSPNTRSAPGHPTAPNPSAPYPNDLVNLIGTSDAVVLVQVMEATMPTLPIAPAPAPAAPAPTPRDPRYRPVGHVTFLSAQATLKIEKPLRGSVDVDTLKTAVRINATRMMYPDWIDLKIVPPTVE